MRVLENVLGQVDQTEVEGGDLDWREKLNDRLVFVLDVGFRIAGSMTQPRDDYNEFKASALSSRTSMTSGSRPHAQLRDRDPILPKV